MTLERVDTDVFHEDECEEKMCIAPPVPPSQRSDESEGVVPAPGPFVVSRRRASTMRSSASGGQAWREMSQVPVDVGRGAVYRLCVHDPSGGLRQVSHLAPFEIKSEDLLDSEQAAAQHAAQGVPVAIVQKGKSVLSWLLRSDKPVIQVQDSPRQSGAFAAPTLETELVGDESHMRTITSSPFLHKVLRGFFLRYHNVYRSYLDRIERLWCQT